MDYTIKIKRKKINLFKDGWIWRLAFRDARHNIGRLFLFISSIVIGIAALVAINAFNINLQDDIDDQARELLGADLEIDADDTGFDPGFIRLLDSLDLRYASDAEFASMVFFPKNEGTRLIQVKAIEGAFPFYGDMELWEGSDPERFYKGNDAMIDENLAMQFDIGLGDSLRLGQAGFLIAAVITRFPGNTTISTSFAPAVYIPYHRLEETGLIQYGSRVDYHKYIMFGERTQEEVLALLEPAMEKNDYRYDTIEEEKEELGEDFNNLYKFFNLLSFVALILGSIGVASSVHIYVREKREIAAVLRCLGASGWQVFYVFFLQVILLGLIGTLLGIFHGILIQYLLPYIVQDFIPIDVTIRFTWIPVLEGLIVGLVMSVLFAVLPLSNIRLVSPLAILRSAIEPVKRVSKFRYFIFFCLILFPWIFAVSQTSSLVQGSLFVAGLIVTFSLLWLVGWLIIHFTRKYFPAGAGFIWRQSLANLFRPNNQTIILVVVIGLGSFLLSNMALIQNSLLGQVEFAGSGERPNTVLFDIQPYQRAELLDFIREENIAVRQFVPIVTTRLRSVKGRTIQEWQEDTTDHIPNWSLTREYRVTYRDSLIDSEKLVAGEFISGIADMNDSIFISVSDGMAERMTLEVGDELEFNVQGLPLKTWVGSIRQVDWQRIQTNFMVVFPKGVLEEAPQFYVLVTRIADKEKAAAFQRELVKRFPNVSMIDLTLILNTLDEIFSKVELVIRFMALFSVLTGLVVLSGAVINSKYARLKENVLLRTMGALKRQLVGMTLVEYGYLGMFAALTGTILSIAASWILAKYFFEIEFFPDFISLAAIWIIVSLLTMLVGWFNTRSILNRSPLEVLRREV
jgi:putative ABC transport system permease protein